ncbi:hypothetical protein G8A07_05520 [Roseateles sp. DAIF2]|uniref:DUF3592 domain-containing protein n=1 Tax=Roseateles sp. DAIF2 TaxID=2714952 RepID=UPI0018A27D7E|nr:DUF3592 domain-containing protein [Roseateles sp. DAIF2]QPF72446.1 hypothetical protein G8A07_05520 [Roseateles sp. DAIF2]
MTSRRHLNAAPAYFAVPRVLCLLLAALAFYAGLQQAAILREALRPDSAYRDAAGELLEVIKHVDGDEHQVQHFAELRFRYRVDGAELQGNQFSPLCSPCLPAEVLRVLGRRPSQLEPGMALTVHVLRQDPAVAYLALPEAAALRRQWLETGLLLLVAPAFCLWLAWSFRSGD